MRVQNDMRQIIYEVHCCIKNKQALVVLNFKSVYLHPLNDKPQNKRIHVYDPKSYN